MGRLFFLLAVIMACCNHSSIAQNASCHATGNQLRVLNYYPDGEFFVNVNGENRFTRAIYGTNSGFRFETSDFPEIGLYMPRLGGSMYFALQKGKKRIWVKDLQRIESRFRSGERSYVLEDSVLLGRGRITFTMVALSDADGMVMRMESHQIPSDVRLICIFGGANRQRFSREGDIGADPKDCFFIKPGNCKGNVYEIAQNRFTLSYGKGTKGLADAVVQVAGLFPKQAQLKLVDANVLSNLDRLLSSSPSENPLITADFSLAVPVSYLLLVNPETYSHALNESVVAEAFHLGEKYREKIAGRIKIDTPDPYFNTLGGVLAGGEDAVWESPSYLHGAIGWRMPLTGWRAAYLGDLMGMHQRARTHFEGYANAQLTQVPVFLPHLQDSALHLARALKKFGTPMYSNGYICRYPNRKDVMHHYDMNLVFIDELLWHLNWTGDLDYARKVFPVLKRHLAWEQQLFDPDNDGLYDAYCCIWASDGLQYNGGVATHSSAYNYRANKMTAMVARLLGEDDTPYESRATLILNAINKRLWLPRKGWWAEFQDNMGQKRVHESAAVWSFYHAIDSEVNDPFQAYEATRYVDTRIPHIPVRMQNDADQSNYVVSTTDWQPYIWSINNVAFAEIAHTAYAYWLSGRGEEAFHLLKGALLDAMYLGSGPGNITQISAYDAARGEMYRDFADPLAVCLRSVVQGMYGILPDLLNHRLLIRPQFPSSWGFASLKTLNMEYDYRRSGMKDRYTFIPKLQKQSCLTLEVQARGARVKRISVNGKTASFRIPQNVVGSPRIAIDAGVSGKYLIEIEWDKPLSMKEDDETSVIQGERVLLGDNDVEEWYDPQQILKQAKKSHGGIAATIIGEIGHRTLFVKRSSGDLVWWKPIPISIHQGLEIQSDSLSPNLSFTLINPSSKTVKGTLQVNQSTESYDVYLPAGGRQHFECKSPEAMLGTNSVKVNVGRSSYDFSVINWNIEVPDAPKYQTIVLTDSFNDKVRDIYAFGKYLSPRWPYTTLCVPTQGMGQWCHPNALSAIDDRGIRKSASLTGGTIRIQGVPFITPSDVDANNVAFTSLWDNYPDKITIPLNGTARKAYLLIAASTYYMQCNFQNGLFRVEYEDGTSELLDLVLPDNLLPLDQDIFIDGQAFRCKNPRPFRISLKYGLVTRNPASVFKVKMSNDPLYIDGGLATMMDIPLNPKKRLKSISLQTTANEVIIGLMGVTLVR